MAERTLAEIGFEIGATGGALEPGLGEGEDETGDPAAEGMDAKEHPEKGEVLAACETQVEGDGEDPQEGDDDGGGYQWSAVGGQKGAS